MEVFTGCLTDKGNYREKNQDCAVCHMKKSGKSVLVVGCVCDGIGSFAQSEIASEMVTAGITRWFSGIGDLFPDAIDEETLLEDLEATIRELNELVCACRRERGIDIGCTMSVILLINHSYHVFHVGDSRIYQVSDSLCQITRDEVAMMESSGQVRPFLINYIGKSPKLWLNKMNGTVERKDLFLIGSDGLFKRLTFEDVRAAAAHLKSDRHAREACEQLLGLVLERGERDNISCILISVASAR